MFNIPEKYLKNSKNISKILAVNAQAYYRNGDRESELVLDINKKNIIVDAGYSLTNMDDYAGAFSFYIDTIKGLNLDEVFSLDFGEVKKEEVLFLPHVLFSNALESFYGEDKKYLEISMTKREDLICRCFGVGKSSIKELLIGDSHLDIKSVMNETQASTGCGTCSHKVLQAITELRDFYHIIPGYNIGEFDKRFDNEGQRVRPARKTPFELVPMIHEHLMKLDSDVNLVNLKGYELEINGQVEGITADFIENHLFNNLNIKFKVIFSS